MSGAPLSDQQRTALLSVFAAGLLVAIKLVTGLLTGSLGLLAEAAHSGTDLVAALLTFFAVRVAVRPPDREHPFGHGKAEHLAALAEATFLVAVSLAIAWQSVARLSGAASGEVDVTWYAIAVLLAVVAIDAGRAIVSRRAARRHNSPALAANALHFGSDLLGTVAVLFGLILAAQGFPEADSIAALAVAVLVVLAAFRLIRQNVQVLMDQTPGGADDLARLAIAAAEPDVELRRVRVREAAGRHFVDIVAGVDADAAMAEGHAVADSIETAIHAALPGSDVVVHVEPAENERDLRERASGAALAVRGVREVHNVRVLSIDGRLELSLHLKLPSELDLTAAHRVACQVEEAIGHALPQLSRVHTHIEPLTPAGAGERPRASEVADESSAIREVVRELTGRVARDVRFQSDERGLVALLTVDVPAGRTLADAHAQATEIELQIRRRAPRLVEVVVHTEPR